MARAGPRTRRHVIGESAGMTSRTASRSPASLLNCPTVSAYGAGTHA